MKKLAILLLAGILLGSTISAANTIKLYLYAADGTFLGCLTEDKYEKDSIWNKYGNYGSIFSEESIWNEYGPYGASYNEQSPWNKHSMDPPLIKDQFNCSYGYFTINEYNWEKTTNKYCLWILENYEWIRENFDEAADRFKDIYKKYGG